MLRFIRTPPRALRSHRMREEGLKSEPKLLSRCILSPTVHVTVGGIMYIHVHVIGQQLWQPHLSAKE